MQTNEEMTETGRLEISDKDNSCLSYFLFLVAFVTAGLIVSIIWYASEPEPDGHAIGAIGVLALLAIFYGSALFYAVKWTVTTLDKSAAIVEVRKYTFCRRNPELHSIPMDEVDDVLVVPDTLGGRPYGVWLLLGDRSVQYLRWFVNDKDAIELRDRVASFLALPASQSTGLQSGSGA
jgi:hypothetical protein